jgi:hypothetical protein
MNDEKDLCREISELRRVIESGFIALIAHQLHTADRARGVDYCVKSAVNLISSAASSELNLT